MFDEIGLREFPGPYGCSGGSDPGYHDWCELARRPLHLAFAEEVDVEMGDAFAAVGAIVDDDPESFGEIEFLRHITRGEHEMA